MSLSSRIVQRGVATIREVEEALARQVLYGGDLVTNLLEVSRIEESSLIPIVAEELGLPPAPIGELPRASAEAKRLVAGEVALERALAPLFADAGGLVVAVAEPLPKDAEQELAFALALPISQQLAPLVRIRQALLRDYGVPLDRRFARLLAKILDGGPPSVSHYPAMRAAPDVKPPPKPPSMTPPPQPRPPTAPPVRAPGTPDTLLRAGEAPPARPAKRRRGPLTLDVGVAELEDATERDTIFDLLFEFARQYFDYTALFVVHGEIAEGRDAFGQGAPREKVARIGVPLDMPSLLATARSTKQMARGKGDPSGVDGVLARDLSRPGGTECVVLPVVVRTRVVALLFGDGGEAGIDANGLRDVEKMRGQAIAAFERIIVRRKLLGSVPPARSAKDKESIEPQPVEELAPPIRELLKLADAPPAPLSKDAQTSREPTPEVVITTSRVSEPPPPNLLVVRRPSGRPIPREEPESASRLVAAPVAPPRTRSSASHRRAVAPPLEFAAQPVASPAFGAPLGMNDTEQRLLAEIQGDVASAPATTRDPVAPMEAVTDPPPPGEAAENDVVAIQPAASPKAQSPIPPRPHTTDVSPSFVLPAPRRLAIEIDDDPPGPHEMDLAATPLAPPVTHSPVSPVRITSSLQSSPISSDVQSPKPMPQSEQVISVAPHRPPSSHDDSERGLPSVIIDNSAELAECVEKVISSNDDDAEAELLRAGAQAMAAIMARFPGPITIEPERLAKGPLPRVAECGPVLRLVASQRRTALPAVLTKIESEDIETRFWATYLVTELVYPDAVDAVVKRSFDAEPRVRRAARAAARALAEAHPAAVVDRLAALAAKGSGPTERVLAIETLAETREPLAVAPLIPMVEDRDTDVAEAARAALSVVTRQDFEGDAAAWRAWWTANKERHRIEWLIDALMHDHAAIRAVAGEELKTITKEYFGYYDDLPKRERERAQSRYRDWWSTVGRVRFSRAAMRGS